MNQVNEVLNRVNVSDLKSGYSIFGNKGSVWNDTAHIYKSGEGNLCGTPALSSNWARIEEVKHIGCPECLVKYTKNMSDLTEVTRQCPWCSKLTTVSVDTKQYTDYDGSLPVQIAFPDLSDDDREILLTGICAPCWDGLKGPDED